METPSNTQPDSETLKQQNPSSTHEEENQQPPPPNSQPQSPNSETLETSDPQITEHSDPHLQTQAQEEEEEEEQKQDDPQVPDQEEREDQENQEQLGKFPSPRPSAINISNSDSPPPPITSPVNPSRRFNYKRRKGALHITKQRAIDKKFQTLFEKFNTIPFIPSKILDFTKHEKLLKQLGLWDFVHIDFDRDIRNDLIAQLIVSYDKRQRCSYVNGNRIGVSRPDLARALKLPVKKEKANNLEEVDLDSDDLSDESISFLEDFLSNWVLLHEDTWIMPSELQTSARAIKDSHPEKVDWAKLIWLMVEKELSQGLKLKNCYYASHLQHLLKTQKAEMVMEEPKVETKLEVKEEDDNGENKLKIGYDLKVEEIKESDGPDEPSIELTLGQDSIDDKEEVKGDDRMNVDESKEDLQMDVDESKEEESEQPGQHGQWLFDGKNEMGQHFMQPCQIEESRDLDSNEEERKMEEEEEEEEEMEDGFHIDPNENGPHPVGDGLTGNLLQGMEETHIPYEFSSELPSRSETHTILGGSSIFGKREMEHSVIGGNKRMRSDGFWDQESSDAATYVAQIQHLAEKARIMIDAKEQAYQQTNMNQEIMFNELQQRDAVIQQMHKNKCEEIQKKDAEIYRLERELFVMGNLLEGYGRALKETNKAFSEYRQKFQLPEESIYKDAGPGGVVLGPVELEKERVKKEEEDRLNRLIIQQKFKEIEEGFAGKIQVNLDQIKLMDERLMDFETEVRLMKESRLKKKVPEVSESGADESVACDAADTES